jgi:hypothetical protein
MIISVLSAMPFTALADDTCIVVGSNAYIFGTEWDGSNTANTMESDGNGRYTKTYTVNEAYSKVQCKVVKNGSEWFGDIKGLVCSISGLPCRRLFSRVRYQSELRYRYGRYCGINNS